MISDQGEEFVQHVPLKLVLYNNYHTSSDSAEESIGWVAPTSLNMHYSSLHSAISDPIQLHFAW